jgi:hypothetical protein
MSEFQFQKSQRVMLPGDIAGAECVWGVVVGNFAKLGREPLYDVQWQSSDSVSEEMLLVTHTATIAESRLLQAQPAPSVAVDAVDKMLSDAYRRGADELRAELDLERIHRAAKRKRAKKPATRKRR